MVDNNKDDFHKRLARLDKMDGSNNRAARKARTGVFDQNEEERRKKKKFPIKRFVFLLIILVVGGSFGKAYIATNMGEDEYQARISELNAGERPQQIAAMLISREPLMAFFEERVFQKLDVAVSVVKDEIEEVNEKNADQSDAVKTEEATN